MDECCHLLPPGQCAYCSGSWRREQEALAREQRAMLARIAKKGGGWGTKVVDGWTSSVG